MICHTALIKTFSLISSYLIDRSQPKEKGIVTHHTMELVSVQSVLDQMLYNILVCSLERVKTLTAKFAMTGLDAIVNNEDN